MISFFLCAFLCLTFSTLYHTFGCHSANMCLFCGRLDYTGISVLITGSFIPWLYYSFYCSGLTRSVNSYAFGTTPRSHLTFKTFFGNFYNAQSLRPKMIILTKKSFHCLCTLQITKKIYFDREKIHFSLAILQISPKNRIQAAIKV